ncbi:MAG: trypsin-like peptidase domain-containing protein [Cyanobacteriota bacterium]|nr:trypsin-like peptidase domain-containing protein [Cyanobacteriota bacterium]
MRLERLLLCVASLGLVCTPALSSAPVPTVLAQAQSEEQTSINVYRTASPAVVTISTGRGSGSGSIVSPEGLILTNNHVVRAARGGQVSVSTSKGKRYTGQVLATDPSNDLALVRLNTTDRLPMVRLSNAENIQVGQRVFAIGSPFGLSGTLTTGILSRIGRNGDLQTDAALNPGNSGGPLLNSRGELIGVNKAILSTGGGNIGIGFATSAVVAKDFIQQNRNRSTPSTTVKRPPSSTPSLGVTLDARTLVILGVQPGSLAANLGLRRGDRLLGINGRRLRGIQDLAAFLESRPSSAIFTVGRNRSFANVRVDF